MSPNMNFKFISIYFKTIVSFAKTVQTLSYIQKPNDWLFLEVRRAAFSNFKVVTWSPRDVGNEKDENAAKQQSEAGEGEGKLAVAVEQQANQVWAENAPKSSNH